MRKTGCPSFYQENKSWRDQKNKRFLSLYGSGFHSWVEKLKSNDSEQSTDVEGCSECRIVW